MDETLDLTSQEVLESIPQVQRQKTRMTGSFFEYLASSMAIYEYNDDLTLI